MRISPARLREARDQLERSFRAALMEGFAAAHRRHGLTVEQLAARIGRDVQWVVDRLVLGRRLRLRDISDIATGCGFEIIFKLVPLEEVEEVTVPETGIPVSGEPLGEVAGDRAEELPA